MRLALTPTCVGKLLHYAWGTNILCECMMDVNSTWIPTWHQMDHASWSHGLFQKPPPGGRPNTKPGDYGTANAHNCWFILFHNVWGPTWIEIHWNRIWLRALSQMTSHYTWGPLTTQHGLGGVLGWPLDTLFGVSQFYGQGSWLVKWPQVADHSNPQLRQLIHLSIGSTSNLYFPFLK